MADNEIDMTELRGEIEALGNSMAFLVDVIGSGLTLSERGQVGFLEFGHYSQQRFSAVEDRIRNYVKGSAPS